VDTARAATDPNIGRTAGPCRFKPAHCLDTALVVERAVMRLPVEQRGAVVAG
jgi:hypothetical protein